MQRLCFYSRESLDVTIEDDTLNRRQALETKHYEQNQLRENIC